MWPDETNNDQWTNPGSPLDSGATTPGLWTIHHQVHQGDGLQMAYTFGKFQKLGYGAVGPITYFDYGYWTEQAATSKVAVFAPPLISTSKRDGLELTRLSLAGTTT